MYPSKLKIGDEIRVIAPSRSLSVVREDVYNNANKFLKEKGYNITFSDNSREIEYDESASIKSRVEDLHNAFLDNNVKAILTSIGGFNVNQILEYIDYSIIMNNPKIICGYSDITALLNAIHAKTGLITYHGPHFCSFGFGNNRNYTYEYFEKCVNSDSEYKITPSFEANRYVVIQDGNCEGTVIGGNLCTLNLLQGTEFMPKMKDVILFIEDDNIMGKYFIGEFERNLQSLLQIDKCKINGVVFGRFSDDCNLTVDKITQIVKSKRQLKNIPIIFNTDFGHVFPFVTFPIGGTVTIAAKADCVDIVFKQH
ncbi:muramoyltetrapeptide carboxypeptidase [Hydrogenoanaerobacterium saccharovorans]|uniref:Muramoyltetrapeptide carboxypeptidase n=2 Tax=Hydrogenoanaerobacterium saccharovorans TaxID=474960 RepID=A0A1H8BKA2_9FIRM|nr:muramoyltetrapeptide carboxypeptidase [Hydrogenoanaerobacterium saccharovorans]SEM83295.1 muramoyltetrapeptide carboxypeptidase [Hydrogenoanaerobacterium saccharovorans]